MRRVAPAIALFFLSPLVAEFLLGDFTFAQLPYLVLLAPAYGGAAVLLREVTRRAGRGWPTMILLALAYGVLEEGVETQSLFNPDYVHAHLLDHGFVPALGIAVPWTLFVLTLHTVWSMSVPIALVEEWTTRRTVPWLRTFGLIVAGVLASIGAAGTFAASYSHGHFMASPNQLVTVVVIAAALAAAAFLLPSPFPRPTDSATPAPSPWLVLAVTLAGGGLFFAATALPVWLGVALLIAVLAAVATAVLLWSRRPGWNGRHRLAVAAGGLLTYAWHSFLSRPLSDGPAVLIPISHAFFAVLAVLLLALETRRVRLATSIGEVSDPDEVRAGTGPVAGGPGPSGSEPSPAAGAGPRGPQAVGPPTPGAGCGSWPPRAGAWAFRRDRGGLRSRRRVRWAAWRARAATVV
jgi:hypothetical protein